MGGLPGEATEEQPVNGPIGFACMVVVVVMVALRLSVSGEWCPRDSLRASQLTQHLPLSSDVQRIQAYPPNELCKAGSGIRHF